MCSLFEGCCLAFCFVCACGVAVRIWTLSRKSKNSAASEFSAPLHVTDGGIKGEGQPFPLP
jgi:hypothetical protein